MSNKKPCPKCGRKRIEWSFEGHGGQLFCRSCAKFTITLPRSAYELYAGKVKKVAKEDGLVFLTICYPAKEKGRELVFTSCGGIMDPTTKEFDWDWIEGSLVTIAGRSRPNRPFQPEYVKDLVSGKDGFLEQVDLKDYIPLVLTESIYFPHPIGIGAKEEIKKLSSKIEKAIGPLKPSKTLVESLMAGETPKELHRVRGSDLDEKLVDAAGKGDFKAVKRLIKNGADVNAKVSTLATYMGSLVAFDTPLMAAVGRKDNMEVVRYLVEQGADPALEREIQTDEGISDVKLEGTGKYESAIDLGAPELLRVCDIVVNLIASISGATFSFPVNEWTNYSDAQLAEVHAFLKRK